MTHKLHNTEQYRDHAEAVVKSDINTSLNSLNSVEAHSIIEAYKPQFETISSSTIKEKNLLRLAIYANLIDSNNIGNVIVERNWILSNMKATQILINTIQPNGLSYWVDQDGKINKDGRGEFRTGEDGIYGKITQNCLKELFGLHIPLSATARPTTVAETSKPAQVEKTDASLALISSTLPEGVSQQQVLELAYEQIGKPLTTEKIKGYQIRQRIEIDTVNVKIGLKTYGEMYARVLEKKVRTSMRVNNHITNSLQGEILELFSYANLGGKNIIEPGNLLSYIYLIKREGTEDLGKDRFEQVYGDFFKQIELKFKAHANDQKVQEKAVKELEAKNENGLSVGGGIIAVAEGKMTKKEFIQDFKGPALLVGIIAFILIGNKFPGVGNLPGVGSIFGRIAYVIGGAYLGIDDLAVWGADKVADGISAGNAYVRSPEAKGHYQAGEDWIVGVWDTLTDSETYGKGTDAVRKIFNTTIGSMESANEALKATDAGKYIEGFTGKSSIILSDASFLNTPKSQITGISNLKELEAIMTAEGYKKLIDTHKMSDSDVRNFISQHMSSRLKDAKDTDIVRQTIFGASVVLEAKQALLDSSKNFNTNPAINTSIKTELSNILNGSGSETYKQAGTNLGIALQTGTLDQFSLEAYKSLGSTEKSKLDTLLKRLLAIQTVQEYIENQVLRVNAVEIKTEGLADTPTTLAEDFVKLEKIKTDFALNTSHVSESGINENDYETSAFEMAYVAKRQEILEYAAAPKRDDGTGGLGLTAIGSVKDIEAELGKAEREKIELEKRKKIEELIGELSPFPTSQVSFIDIKSLIQENEEIIKQLGDIKKELDAKNPVAGTLDFVLLEKINLATERYSTIAIEKYNELAKELKRRISELEAEINTIPGNTTDISSYKAARSQLAVISQEYDKILEGVVKSWTSKTGENITGFFTNLVNTKDTAFDSVKDSDNAFKYLHKQLGGAHDIDIYSIKDLIGDKIIELEANLDVTIADLSGLDISKAADVRKVKAALTESSETLDEFLSDSLREKNFEKIKTEVVKVEQKFIESINLETDSIELDKLYTLYESEFRDFLKSNGKVIGNWFTKYFMNEDKVKDAYDAQLIKLQANKERIEQEKRIQEVNEKLERITIKEEHIIGEDSVIGFILPKLKEDKISFPTNAFILVEELNGYLIDPNLIIGQEKLTDAQKSAIQKTIDKLGNLAQK